MKTINKTMKGYKAFGKDLTCKGFKYKVGKEYKTDKLKICESGFHFCENPLDVLDFYDLTNCEFAEIKALGKIETEDKKSVTDDIKINAKLDLNNFIKASFNFLWEKCNKKGKDDKDSSQLASSGYYSIVAGIGIDNQAKGIKGNWLVLAEWVFDNKINKYIPLNVKSVKIDGVKIKENIYYELKDGKFIEWKG